jgi:diguanylate cyclase
MTEEELKKKIINTINHYETKCDSLQGQISTLRTSIGKLAVLSEGFNQDVDNHLVLLRKDIKEDVPVDVIQQRIDVLIKLMLRLEEKKEKNISQTKEFITRLTASLKSLAAGTKEHREFSELEKLLTNETEDQIIIDKFNHVFNYCVSSVNKQLDFLKSNSEGGNKTKLWGKSSPTDLLIDPKVNESLHDLLLHLSVPSDLEVEANNIQRILNQKIHFESLIEVIDALTALVIEAFNLEQSRFKGFLHKLTTQLIDVDKFLKENSDDSQASFDDTKSLESDIQENILQIKEHIDNANSINDLAEKVSDNLECISTNLKEFKEKEQQRLHESEKRVTQLKTELMQTESFAEELKISLSFQKYRAKHDSLTGLPNREAYDEHIIEAYRRWERGFGELSIAVADIDFFKNVNDTYGHLAGDKVLKKISSILKSSVRSVDFVARYGGEEFVLIFERTELEDATQIAEKLRKAVQDCEFHFKSTPVEVTISFGLTETKSNDSIEDIFARADDALYEAKKGGRNQVISQ